MQSSSIISYIFRFGDKNFLCTTRSSKINGGNFHTVRTGFGKLRKSIEIESAVFQDLESFGKERIFKMVMENFWIFVWKKIFKIS